jgi:predicted cobalt transporter CbtA
MPQPHVSSLLARGLLAGLLAAIVAFGVARIWGEPQVDRAIRFEEQHAAAHHEPEEKELVTRDIQSTLGLGTGVLAAGLALGGITGLVFAFAMGRIPKLGVRGTALVVALGGFVVLSLVPFLKYPPNPPAIGNADTISRRTILYLSMIVLSVLICVVALQVGPALTRRFGAWNGTIATGAIVLGLLAIAYLAMPGVQEVPAGFPAVVLFRFRVASIGIQLVMWTTLGLVYGALAEREYARVYGAEPVPSW